MFTRTIFLLAVFRSTTTSGAAAAMSVAGWTDVAIKATKNLAIGQLEKLEAAGALDVKRPVIIKAERLETAEQMMRNPEDLGVDTKIIHFQRHGQGYHNLLGDVWREMKIPVLLDSTDIKENPFLRPEIADSPLTESGRQQSMARREQAALLNPQVVFVSPLLRALQTAAISFSSHRHNVPWIAHEGTREELGLLLCNKRRTLSEIQADFPDVDFSLLTTEQDDLFLGDRREGPLEMSERVYDFMTNCIRKRDEKEIAVVGHSAWLFNMCNAVMDCEGDEDLESWFLTSEIKSMKVTFLDREE